MKGVILAGGTGSRLYPLTRITNKHLLPLYDRPMISYAVEALVKAGIDDLMVVTGGIHAGEFLRLLGNGHEYGISRLAYAYQDQPGGIAQALGLAQRFVGNEKMAVLLADNVFEASLLPAVTAFASQPAGARILLTAVDDVSHLRSLGVAELDDQGGVRRILEKPRNPPSRFAVTGLYFYGPDVFEVVEGLHPSARGELEITDVNNHYLAHGTLRAEVIDGFWGDAGESIEWYYAVNDFVRERGVNKDSVCRNQPSRASSSNPS